MELKAATYAPCGNLATASIKIEVHRGRELRPAVPVGWSSDSNSRLSLISSQMMTHQGSVFPLCETEFHPSDTDAPLHGT